MKSKMLFLGLLLVLSGVAYAVDDNSAKHDECMQMGVDEGLSGAALEEFVQECMQSE